MPDLSAAALVDLIVERAPELRKAGVLEIAIGDFKVSLAPHQAESASTKADDEKMPVDPLLDPHTYGLPEGSKIPGLSHLEVVEETGKR